MNLMYETPMENLVTWERVVSAPYVRDNFDMEVFHERRAQHKKWGEQNWPDGTDILRQDDAKFYRAMCEEKAQDKSLTWRDILREEVAEAFAEVNPNELKAELIQCAAVIKAWHEAIDRRIAQYAVREN